MDNHYDTTSTPPAGLVVAVLGGCGGAGVSTLATGLALTAANRGHRVLLIEADPNGGGLDLLLGWEDRDGARWPQLAGAVNPPGPPMTALPHSGHLSVVSCSRHDQPATLPAEAMATMLDSGRRSTDLVVVDLPRWIDPTTGLVLNTTDECLLVVPAVVRAVCAAAAMAPLAGGRCRQARLVIRPGMRGGLTADQVARHLRLPVAGVLRRDQALPAAAEHGQLATLVAGRGPWAQLCARLVNQLDLPVRRRRS